MNELLDRAVFFIIISLLISSFIKKHNALLCLFLIGFTQIGSIYPSTGQLRIEYLVGALSIFFVLLSPNSIGRIFSLENQTSKYFLLFVIVTLCSIPFAVSPSDAAQWFVYYFKRCFIYYFLIVALLDSTKKIKSFVLIYIVAVFWLETHAVINFITHRQTVIVNGVERVLGSTGILSNPNGLANTIVQTLPFLFYFAKTEDRQWKKYILISIGILGVVAVIMTGSRGGFIGLVATSIFITAFSKNKKIGIGIFLASFIVLLMLIGPSLLERYISILKPGEYDITGTSRTWGLIHGISMFIKRPILGVGIGCYPIARAEWFDYKLWAHNTFGQLIGELGILGTFTWSFLVYHTVKGARKIRNFIKKRLMNEQTFLYYLMLAIELSIYTRLILGMTTHSLHIFFWYVNAALVIAVGYIVYNDHLSLQEGN